MQEKQRKKEQERIVIHSEARSHRSNIPGEMVKKSKAKQTKPINQTNKKNNPETHTHIKPNHTHNNKQTKNTKKTTL